MNKFQPEENFVPSKGVKDWWLWTHKSPQRVAGVHTPGLFQTTYYEWQLIGFFLTFLLEGVAAYWSFATGVAITAIFVLIFIDILLAIISHYWHRAICRLENENVFSNEERRKANERKIVRLKAVTWLFYLLILTSAFLKCSWFYQVYQIFDSTALFIFVCYMIGALLHISCTGYAIYTFIFKIRIQKEHNVFIESEQKKFCFDPAKPLLGKIETSLGLSPTEVGRHKILLGNDGFFYFATLGILTDEELRSFIFCYVDKEQQRVIAIEGVRHQYRIWQQ